MRRPIHFTPLFSKQSLALPIVCSLILSLVTPSGLARGIRSRNQNGGQTSTNGQGNPRPGVPAGRQLPNLDDARTQRPIEPKAPPPIPSTRPAWSPSRLSVPLAPAPIPGARRVMSGNTESANSVTSADFIKDELDQSFAAQRGLLASASPSPFRDDLPGAYRNAVRGVGLLDVYSMFFDRPGLKLPGSPEPAARMNEFNPISFPNPVPFERFIISEFRLRGPNGVADEYIEFTNVTGQSITVATTDGSSGWALVAINSSGATTTKFVIPKGTTLGIGRHYLATNSGYSLNAYAAADQAYSGDIEDNTGIALFNTANSANFNLNNRIDARRVYDREFSLS